METNISSPLSSPPLNLTQIRPHTPMQVAEPNPFSSRSRNVRFSLFEENEAQSPPSPTTARLGHRTLTPNETIPQIHLPESLQAPVQEHMEIDQQSAPAEAHIDDAPDDNSILIEDLAKAFAQAIHKAICEQPHNTSVMLQQLTGSILNAVATISNPSHTPDRVPGSRSNNTLRSKPSTTRTPKSRVS